MFGSRTDYDLSLYDEDGEVAAIATITSVGDDDVAAAARDLLEEEFGDQGDGTTNLADLVDGYEQGVAAILREGVEQHRSSVRDEDVPMTEDELGAALDLAKVVEDVQEGNR